MFQGWKQQYARIRKQRIVLEVVCAYKLALQVPAATVTEVTDHQASDEVDEQDTGHREDHINDRQLQHLLGTHKHTK